MKLIFSHTVVVVVSALASAFMVGCEPQEQRKLELPKGSAADAEACARNRTEYDSVTNQCRGCESPRVYDDTSKMCVDRQDGDLRPPTPEETPYIPVTEPTVVPTQYLPEPTQYPTTEPTVVETPWFPTPAPTPQPTPEITPTIGVTLVPSPTPTQEPIFGNEIQATVRTALITKDSRFKNCFLNKGDKVRLTDAELALIRQNVKKIEILLTGDTKAKCNLDKVTIVKKHFNIPVPTSVEPNIPPQ